MQYIELIIIIIVRIYIIAKCAITFIRTFCIKKRCTELCTGVVRTIVVSKTGGHLIGPRLHYAKIEYEFEGIKRCSISNLGMKENNAYCPGEKIDIYVNPKETEDFIDEKSRAYGYQTKKVLFILMTIINAVFLDIVLAIILYIVLVLGLSILTI